MELRDHADAMIVCLTVLALGLLPVSAERSAFADCKNKNWGDGGVVAVSCRSDTYFGLSAIKVTVTFGRPNHTHSLSWGWIHETGNQGPGSVLECPPVGGPCEGSCVEFSGAPAKWHGDRGSYTGWTGYCGRVTTYPSILPGMGARTTTIWVRRSDPGTMIWCGWGIRTKSREIGGACCCEPWKEGWETVLL